MSVSLSLVRGLRQRAGALNASATADVQRFLRKDDRVTYKWLPQSPEKEGTVSVATTCTAFMCLAEVDGFGVAYPLETEESIEKVVRALMSDPWDSARLPKDNSFTTVLVLRTMAHLHERGMLPSKYIGSVARTHKAGRFANKSLSAVIRWMSARIPTSLAVDEYAPHLAVGYWWVDGVSRLPVKLRPQQWESIADWGAEQFRRQVSLISSRDCGLMDPIAVGMGACMLKRLAALAQAASGVHRVDLSLIPSPNELEQGVSLFFGAQQEAGSWGRYFPLFHYPQSGANYCWCFEVLEAILREFDWVTKSGNALEGLNRALTWAESNRLSYRCADGFYEGWNSGGQESTLSEGVPELWATGAMHMFLSQLRRSLTRCIQEQVLRTYAAIPAIHSRHQWDRLLDSHVVVSRHRRSLKRLLENTVIAPIVRGGKSRDGIVEQIDARSVVLFGPPGTAKTSLVRAVASLLGWPLIELTPTDFLRDGLDNIYGRTNEIFDDLMELDNVVVLLDEVDRFVRRRAAPGEEPTSDVTGEFLTTSMLPKFQKLYERGTVLFFLATNHLRNFDDAVRRRFDMLLCVGPPSWREKRTRLNAIMSDLSTSQAQSAAEAMHAWAKDDHGVLEALELSTFREMSGFLRRVAGDTGLPRALIRLSKTKFRNAVTAWGADEVELTRLVDGESSAMRAEYDRDRMESRVR